MILILNKQVSMAEVDSLIKELKKQEIEATLSSGEDYYQLTLKGNTRFVDETKLYAYPFIKQVVRVNPSFTKVSRQSHPDDTIVEVGDIKIGGSEKIVLIAGPCSIESEEQMMDLAVNVKEAGANILRGGAYKPRTSPYSFQGLKDVGIQYLLTAGKKANMPIISEITSIENIEEFAQYVDIIQVGARNMQNYELLKILGTLKKPILLKRGFAATIEEWLMAAEYILVNGNPNVILCERGIRSFEPLTRFSLDVSVIPLVKKMSHLPIVIDPSHASGNWELVESLALASIAAGADGLIIEVHDHPELALSDGMQSLKVKNYKALVNKARKVALAIGREIK